MDTIAERYYQRGWYHFQFDPNIFTWATNVLPFADKAVSAKENADWLRCGGTWFVGVNSLPNTEVGSVGDSQPLAGVAIDFIRNTLKTREFEFDQAQLSVCYPGYPQPSACESSSAYQYRIKRDAAHVDGFKAKGALRRRFLDECHHFILGIPLVDFSIDAAPFVIWEGSHELIRAALLDRFKNIPVECWVNEDVTDAYQKIRRDVFKRCKRIEISAKPGEAFVVHRLSLHGIAPWGDDATADPRGRMICYFRPSDTDVSSWLADP